MSSTPLIRTLAVALALSVLGAPAALARPIDQFSSATEYQRHLDASNDVRGASPATQDLRHLNAGNDVRSIPPAFQAALPEERFYSSSGEPATATRPSRVVVVDGGTPWTTIALGIAGACLMLGAAAAFAGRSRLRTRRSHLAA